MPPLYPICFLAVVWLEARPVLCDKPEKNYLSTFEQSTTLQSDVSSAFQHGSTAGGAGEKNAVCTCDVASVGKAFVGRDLRACPDQQKCKGICSQSALTVKRYLEKVGSSRASPPMQCEVAYTDSDKSVECLCEFRFSSNMRRHAYRRKRVEREEVMQTQEKKSIGNKRFSKLAGRLKDVTFHDRAKTWDGKAPTSNTLMQKIRRKFERMWVKAGMAVKLTNKDGENKLGRVTSVNKAKGTVSLDLGDGETVKGVKLKYVSALTHAESSEHRIEQCTRPRHAANPKSILKGGNEKKYPSKSEDLEEAARISG